MDPKEHMPHSDNKVPRVSAYRLATHLAAALTIYGGTLWTALKILNHNSSNQTLKASSLFGKNTALRQLALVQAGIVGVTIISGAFVAGNDAGLDYNTWPKMLDDWVPDKVQLFIQFFVLSAII